MYCVEMKDLPTELVTVCTGSTIEIGRMRVERKPF
jgi:hypothetical protein